jgi:glycosyltransferase involved in cell wall biosynthesis
MKILLVETSPVSKSNAVCVHARNSTILIDYLKQQGHDCRLVWNDEGIPDPTEQFDYMCFVSATFYFKFDRFVHLIKSQKNCKIGWLTNEHDLFQQDFLKQLGVDFIITNFEEWGIKQAHRTYKKFLMVNINTLIAKPRNEPIEKQYDIIYYGTHRKWRVKYFQKYLIKDMMLSTSGKNVKKFLLDGCDCWLTDRLNWTPYEETLNQFRASLYCEDTINHKLYNHLANRMYESLFCNCMVLFDKSCINTIKRSGYYIDDYFLIDSYDEIADKIKNVDPKLLEEFLTINTKIALEDKQKCLTQIEQFLLNY